MHNFAIAIHGGAGEDSPFIKENYSGYEQGLKEAIEAGQAVLKNKGTAMDAVSAAVCTLENNPLFNAGRGSALNHEGKTEMDAAVMNGQDLKAGAVAMVTGVKNPVVLARAVMEKTSHVLLAGPGATEFARSIDMPLEEESYFITQHQLDELNSARQESEDSLLQKPVRGTVGAVAMDMFGNVAAATSTGGTSNSLPGRIGDSCMIGAGCYASNNTCAVSGTGDGEFLIRGVTAHSIAMLMEARGCSVQQACDEVVHQRSIPGGDIGVIAVTAAGEIGISFNSERMHRAWSNGDGDLTIKIYS
jgi:beta-aspartyl-peptidase (threonine type)